MYVLVDKMYEVISIQIIKYLLIENRVALYPGKSWNLKVLVKKPWNIMEFIIC